MVGHAKKERVLLFGTDQRITSGSAATTAAFKGRLLGHLTHTITAETREVATAPPTGTNSPHQTVSASQKPDIVFVQRPGVNIRSAPSTNGRVLGTAPKGARLTVTNREGEWMQVESDQFRVGSDRDFSRLRSRDRKVARQSHLWEIDTAAATPFLPPARSLAVVRQRPSKILFAARRQLSL